VNQLTAYGKAPDSASDRFIRQVLANSNNATILQRLPQLKLQDAWLVAGCLFQTAWNLRAGMPPTANIRDYDLFYFDAADLSEAAEQDAQMRARALFSDLNIVVEVKNQARVHLWYEDWFGHRYTSLRSSRDGIDRFLVTCTCVGIAPTSTGVGAELYAPNGFDDLEAGILRPNPKCNYKDLFEAKVESYKSRWPWLRVA
jgi:hypothetical protein